MSKNNRIVRLVENLGENEIFVFGSNEAGRHGAGAAKLALRWGAKRGQGIGLQGKTYRSIYRRTCPLFIDRVRIP